MEFDIVIEPIGIGRFEAAWLMQHPSGLTSNNVTADCPLKAAAKAYASAALVLRVDRLLGFLRDPRNVDELDEIARLQCELAIEEHRTRYGRGAA